MINSNQLTELIIKPVLRDLILYSEFAQELLLFTCANESEGGRWIKQPRGPALGIYQMTPEVYNDIWQNYINKKSDLKLIFTYHFNAPTMPDEERLVYDLRYATAMARIFYARIPDAMPIIVNIDTLWKYYKTHYNNSPSKAVYTDVSKAYLRFKS